MSHKLFKFTPLRSQIDTKETFPNSTTATQPSSSTPTSQTTKTSTRSNKRKLDNIEADKSKFAKPSQNVSFDQAKTIVTNIINGKKDLYHLVSFSDFEKHGSHILKSDVYKEFEFLCDVNAFTSVGWLVCKYIQTNSCSLQSGIQPFKTSTGTSALKRHIESHNRNANNSTIIVPIGKATKRRICSEAVGVVVKDLRPLCFLDGPGIRNLLQMVFSEGQKYPPNVIVPVHSVVPSTSAVALELKWQLQDVKKKFVSILDDVVKFGGAMSCDGVTLNVQDKQFYDLTLHYFSFGPIGVSWNQRVALRNLTVLLVEPQDGKKASDLRKMLDEKLTKEYGISFSSLSNTFTFVTDSAAVMPNIVNSSVSSNIAPLNEKWMGCLVHQLNTAMKACLSSVSTDPMLARIATDLKAVKEIVRIFKQSQWNHSLSDGRKLIQEVETRFSTTFMVVKRFLSSAEEVFEVIERQNSISAVNAKQNILVIRYAGYTSFPALEAIIDACEMIANCQKKLEGSLFPTIHWALPLLYKCKKKLKQIAYQDDYNVQRKNKLGSFMVNPSEYSKKLAIKMVKFLDEKIKIHNLYVVGCLLHPLMRELQFIPDYSERKLLRSNGMALLKSMFESTGGCSGREPHSQSFVPSSAASNNGKDLSDISLTDIADSHFDVPLQHESEVEKYFNSSLPILGLSLEMEENYMMDDFFPIRFWKERQNTFPYLYRLACRVFATPVSSCTSERVFSTVKNIVTTDRSRLTSEALEDIVVLRSFHNSF